MIYQNYNSITKHLYCTRQLNTACISQIPPSTRHAWKVKYTNNPNVFDPHQHIAQTIAQLKSAIHILSETLPKQKNKKTFWKKHLHTLCCTINDYHSASDKIHILKLINITPQAFTKWINPTACDYSLVNLCVKKHPKQLREEDKNCIKRYMQNPLYEFYNRTQIYWRMRNEKALLISKRTFHKYCDLMGLHKRKQKKNK